MRVNWGMIGILSLTVIIWYGILCWSVWKTLLAIVLGASVCGIILKLKENRY